VAGWGSNHRTADFKLETRDIATALGSMAAVWTHETLEVPITDGVDEVALALRTDAWGRSYRTKVVTTGVGMAPVRSRHGLTLVPEAAAQKRGRVMPGRPMAAGPQLDAAIIDMGRRYGSGAVRLAKIGLEYDPPRQRQD
jgi:hypothetical protein